MPVARIVAVLLLSALSLACKQREVVQLNYNLSGIDPMQVARVETVVGIDPSEARTFFADQPYRSVAVGVGYEVLDIDRSGRRVVLVTHDATLGYLFAPTFVFTLLPPAGGNPPPLVVLSRAVGTSRNMLGETRPLRASFGAGSAVEITIADQRCGGEICAGDELCCDGACWRTGDSATHCGQCGNACAAGESCVGAACRCVGGSACLAGQTCCPAGCFNVMTDPLNCGACGRACNLGESCVAGSCTCVPSGQACATGQVCCDGSGCSSSGCVCGTASCTTTQLCCGGACVNPANDNGNCGMCGSSCAAPLACAGSACKCNGTQVCSAGDACCPGGCARLGDDVNNCGACGVHCAPGELCSAGSCVCGAVACGANQRCCGGACVDPKEDERNCGFCGNVCDPPQVCSAGSCSCEGGPACVGNQTCCKAYNGLAAGCYDLSSDASHCGACDHLCAPGQGCAMGVCASTMCSCTNGNQCAGASCVCNGGAACTGSTVCCSTGCKSLLTDKLNCGVCGRACGPYELCCNGTCTPQSNANCGTCGKICSGNFPCCICETTSYCIGVCDCPTPF